VICTAACGLSGHPGVTIVPEGDPAALASALAAHLDETRPAPPSRAVANVV
jgi:hypothetical protein